MAKILTSQALPDGLQKRLRKLAGAPLLVLDEASRWQEALRQSPIPIPWIPIWLENRSDGWQARLTQHPQLRQGGFYWTPETDQEESLEPPWRGLLPPWGQLARAYLHELVLAGRQVCLLGPGQCRLEQLAGWLRRRGASVSWLDDTSRHLDNQLRLSDILVFFPGFRAHLEAHQIQPDCRWLDFRPDSPPVAGTALEITLAAYTDAAQGSLHGLLGALAAGTLARQETLFELA